MSDDSKLILAVPSKGRLQENAFAFFSRAGLNLAQGRGARDYRGVIAGLEDVEVAFLSASEITRELAQGGVHLGVTGEDLIRESVPDVDQRLVLLAHGSGLRRLADQALAQHTLRVRPEFEVANVLTAVGLVVAGLGVSVLPAYSLARAEAGRVVAVPLVDPVVTRDIVAVCTRARPFSMAAEAFLRLFKESAAKSSG